MFATISWSLNDRDLGGHVGTITLIKILFMVVQQENVEQIYNKSRGFMRKI